ncbi:MAG: D-alanyl-D-alanine carboxypeptidase family protein [Alphaproteobacteria bacterium]|nr:D-alanyl-D-alanine carboxypeptidase family protein [Alphaproteobacteria bacterium]MBN2675217.1 D-alanyl-D-alanine carboxypeptidase family protein [Alphaproteobacteria bacterium]
MKIWKQRKVYINYFLWWFGLRDILPNVIVNKKLVCENDSALVNIINNPKISFSDKCYRRDGCWVRSELVEMLGKASLSLPDGYKLHIFGGWRSLAVQWSNWLENLENKKNENPGLSLEQVKNISRKTSASPENGYGPHQTGGAIDLTIIDTNGKELDMGTPFSEHSKRCVTKYKNISDVAKRNRKILLTAMENAGFFNYPGEWWHYSFGDRAWAAYKGKPCANFGKAKCPDYKLKPKEVNLLNINNIKIAPGE